MSNLKTDAQRRFLEISQRYEELKAEMKILKPELNQTLEEIGIGTYFQDPETNLVYKVTQPSGTYIEFARIGYDRTKRVDEKKGSLSKKEAEEQGFEL